MQYLSTRGHPARQSFSQVLLSGLAEDGGLMLPETLPKITDAELTAWRALPYHALAHAVLSKFIATDDIDSATLAALTKATYTKEVFGTDDITPLRKIDGYAPGMQIEALSNGPTLAFKDMAMQLLGRLFEFELGRRNQTLNILGATSGDTGSAAEYAMRGRKGVNVFMLSPAGRMSAFQRAQMYSLQDANIHNIAVEGVFDDCQDIVKAVSNDLAFKRQYNIGTVNSINWGRISAQVVYYVKGYLAATTANAQKVSFAVPSGNFGNILAGHIAREMGLPIDTLVLATNENNVLAEFFNTGVYRPRPSKETFETSSPSMDISKASNFERFVYHLFNNDAARVAALWREVDQGRAFDVSQTAEWKGLRERFGFVAGTSTHADRLATIREVYEKTGSLIDTHTADAVKVARPLVKPGVPMIVLETALPVKFADTVKDAVGFEPPLTADQQAMMKLPLRVVQIAPDVERVKAIIAGR
ncbi:MAG TPA: threonine synthase [Casimicrobium huifangae]|jgi:threonine synthase|uniref:threonine synthase n=1 Tax=Casimicrobium huifangae TaxID=2591109 RepID=UPI0012EC0D76|nr:threonine synthase [Casimicrobium huifangae]HOB01262.1 threonine synthase [Casimicrobium huifangae]HQA33071.1 threonine synthase [Casimicrobium huifangae]HQD64467.1 threonine synthase [Casimicrobium huifangae]